MKSLCTAETPPMKNKKPTRSASAIVLFNCPQVQSPEPHLSLKGPSLPPECRDGGWGGELPPPGLLMGKGSEPQSRLYGGSLTALTWNQQLLAFFCWSSLSQIISSITGP